MTKKHLFLSAPNMSIEKYEHHFIEEAFSSNWIGLLGKNVTEFENEIVEKTKTKAACALASGTSAIHLALKCANVEPGDLVACSTLTFSASANPIIYQNAIPVFIDSEFSTWNMSPDALERAFVKYEQLGTPIKAAIVVHLYGMVADLDRITELCKRHKVILIEDAAESLGSSYKSNSNDNGFQSTGTFGDFGVFSFNGNKIITSSGGGMLLCNGENAIERANKARFWATQARDHARHYQHSEIGYNYRMSNICAGIGRGQLKILDKRVQEKQFIYSYYKDKLSSITELSFMPISSNVISNCWLTCIQVNKTSKLSPHEIMDALESDDIECRPVWKPMHLQPVFQKYDYIDNGEVAQTLFQQGVCLPSDTNMDTDDLDRVCSIIFSLFQKKMS